MPCVICLFCEYMGSGEDEYEMWDNVVEHELTCHKKELEEMGLMDDDTTDSFDDGVDAREEEVVRNEHRHGDGK